MFIFVKPKTTVPSTPILLYVKSRWNIIIFEMWKERSDPRILGTESLGDADHGGWPQNSLQ